MENSNNSVSLPRDKNKPSGYSIQEIESRNGKDVEQVLISRENNTSSRYSNQEILYVNSNTEIGNNTNSTPDTNNISSQARKDYNLRRTRRIIKLNSKFSNSDFIS